MDELPNDVLFVICSWLYVRDVLTVRRCCKKYHKLLLSKDDAHWLNRIKTTFPYNFHNILNQSWRQQLDRFANFRTVDTGNNITYVDLPAQQYSEGKENRSDKCLRIYLSQDQMTLPWAKNLLIIRKMGTIFLFDIITKSILAQLEQTVDYLWLDVIKHRLVCTLDDCIKVYSLKDNLFTLEIESIFNEPYERIYPTLLDDSLVYFYEGKLHWYSLKTKKIIRSHHQSRGNAKYTVSLIEPYIYEVLLVNRRIFFINKIDFEGRSESLLAREYNYSSSSMLGGIFLQENDHGKLMYVQFNYQGGKYLDLFELKDDLETELLVRVNDVKLNDSFENDAYHVFEACTGNSKYVKYARVSELSVKNISNYIGSTLNSLDYSTWYLGCVPFVRQYIGPSQWITTDLLAAQISIHNNDFLRLCIFYSISKNKIVGMIKGNYFTHFNVIHDKILLAFTHSNDFYIIDMNEDFGDDRTDKEITILFPNQKFSSGCSSPDSLAEEDSMDSEPTSNDVQNDD